MERDSGLKPGGPTGSYSLSVKVIAPGGLWLVNVFGRKGACASDTHHRSRRKRLPCGSNQLIPQMTSRAAVRKLTPGFGPRVIVDVSSPVMYANPSLLSRRRFEEPVLSSAALFLSPSLPRSCNHEPSTRLVNWGECDQIPLSRDRLDNFSRQPASSGLVVRRRSSSPSSSLPSTQDYLRIGNERLPAARHNLHRCRQQR
jgi:hypothetical protein